MRITRSTLRRIIAEEHARILAEAKAPKRDEDKTDEDWAEEQLQGVMDMYGHPDPYGDDEAAMGDLEYDGAGGWKKPDQKGAKKKAWQVAAEKGGKDCLYVIYGGHSVFYVLAPSGLSEEEAEAEGMEVTGDIAGDESMADPLELYEFLSNNDFITTVHDIESAGGEVSKAAFMEQLRDVGEEEGLFASDDEFVNEGEGDADGPDQYDPDDAEGHADAASEYQRHSRFWGGEGGSSLKASHSDFDDVRGSAGPVKRFITRGRQGKPHRVSDDGLDIDSGDESLSESRWAKLAGVLEG